MTDFQKMSVDLSSRILHLSRMKSDSCFLLNGRIYQSYMQIFGIQNRSFKYGDGIFESMRQMNDSIPLFDLHWDRIQEGLNYFELSFISTKQEILNQISQLSKVNLLEQNCRIRLHFFRDQGGLYTPTSHSASLLIEAHPLEQKSWINQAIFDTQIAESITKPKHEFFNHKSASAGIQVKAGLEAKRRNLQEIIVLNHEGEVCEGISNNVWLLIDGVWKTPPLNSGCLNGVFRKKLLLDGFWENIPTREVTLSPSDIYKAERIGFTNAVTGWTEGRLIK